MGLELNQHGQAASQEQASSSWPVIFHGVLSFGSFVARRGDPRKRRPATSAHGKRGVVFIGRHFTARRSPDKLILSCGRAVAVALRATRCLAMPGGFYTSAQRFAQRSGYKKNQRVTRLELATSSLARRCSTTELHPQIFRGSNNVQRATPRNLKLPWPAQIFWK